VSISLALVAEALMHNILMLPYEPLQCVFQSPLPLTLQSRGCCSIQGMLHIMPWWTSMLGRVGLCAPSPTVQMKSCQAVIQVPALWKEVS